MTETPKIKFAFGAAKPTQPAVPAETQPKPPAGPKAFGALFGGAKPTAVESKRPPEASPVEQTSFELPTPAMSIVPAEPDAVTLPDMAANLKALDDMFQEGHGYPEITLASVRRRIAAVMKELKEKPELLSIVQAKDTRNIMAYIQQTQEKAVGTFKEKTAKAAVKSAKKTQKMSFDFSGFGGAVENAAKEIVANNKQLNIESISKFDTSGLIPKFSK